MAQLLIGAAPFFLMKKLLFLLGFYPLSVFGQLFDNTWFLGVNNDTDTTNKIGIQIITFPQGSLQIRQNPELFRFDFNATNTSLSDSSGNVLSYSNGVHIGNADWEIMENGEQITAAWEESGQLWSQWVLMLPDPGKPMQQLFFCMEEAHTPEISIHATVLKYGIVDLSENEGSGKIVLRDQILIQDTLAVGKICACKHANGRDWWVLVNEKNTNRFFRFLIDPEGVHPLSDQLIDLPIKDGLGQAGFSPDGYWYFIFGAISATEGAYMNIFEFDRCSGLLFNQQQYHFAEFINGGGGGIPLIQNTFMLMLM